MKKLFLFVVLVIVALVIWFLSLDKNTIYLIPWKGYEHEKIEISRRLGKPLTLEQQIEESVKKLGYDLKVISYKWQWLKLIPLTKAKAIIVFNIIPKKNRVFLRILKRLNIPKICYSWEPPVVFPRLYEESYLKLFSDIFVLFDDLVKNRGMKKFYYVQDPTCLGAKIPFGQKKLCTMVAGNKFSDHPNELYSERLRVIRFFEQEHLEEFDLYGGKWDAYGFKCYKGPIKSKLETIQKYKFCVCYENMGRQLGYVTEKIFDCFKANCVPVYWGAENITDYIPESCFIDRRNFKSDEEVYRFLKQMSENEYERYLQNIEAYMKSDQFLLFSAEKFVDDLLVTLFHSYDRERIFSSEKIENLKRLSKLEKQTVFKNLL